MTPLALVDALRALPAPLAMAALEQLEAELGPEAVGALGTAWDFWRRRGPYEQRFPAPHERPAIVVYVGGYGAGKTRTAWELLLHLILTGRAIASRIVAATGADARRLVEHRRTGILAHRKPGVHYDWQSSKGFEGELGINDAMVALLSVEAPRTALGDGADVTLFDDPPKCGPSGKEALKAVLKSSRERGTLVIIPTTADGLAMIADVVGSDLAAAGVLVIDLGTSEQNAGNLDENYYVLKAAMEKAGTWNPLGSPSPWAKVHVEEVDACPALEELAVSIDPAKSSGGHACEHGIVGGGRDPRSVIHTRHDRSAVLDAGVNGWPKVAWDLAVVLQREHPGTPWHFVFESNVGKDRAELLNGEERARRRRGEPVPLRRGGWADSSNRAEVNDCEIRFIRAEKDKCRRAESPARLAAQGQVKRAPGLAKLARQQRDLTPTSTDSDAADAENHMIADLAGLDDKTATRQRTTEEQREEGAAQIALATRLNLAIGSRGKGPPPMPTAEDLLMKVEGAPVGDIRCPTPPRAAGRAPSWRTRNVL